MQELKRAIVTAWQQLSQAFLKRSISEWRRRLENVTQCNCGHIEHLTIHDAQHPNSGLFRKIWDSWQPWNRGSRALVPVDS